MVISRINIMNKNIVTYFIGDYIFIFKKNIH